MHRARRGRNDHYFPLMNHIEQIFHVAHLHLQYFFEFRMMLSSARYGMLRPRLKVLKPIRRRPQC
jgi:hypothetical protein